MEIAVGEVLVLGHGIHGYDMACACAVQAGCGVAATPVAVREMVRGFVAGAAVGAAEPIGCGPQFTTMDCILAMSECTEENGSVKTFRVDRDME